VFDAHLANYCVKRMVSCPRLHLGCRVRIPFEKVAMHMKLRCEKRLVTCRLGCGAKLHHDKRSHHEEALCRERMTDCRLDCGAWIPFSKEAAHGFVCPHRIVECHNECGQTMRECDRKHHESVDCIYVPKPCPLGCGDTISPPSKLRLHMKAVCPLRVVKCDRPCGIQGMLAKDKKHHMSTTCPLRPVECNIGCGKEMPLSEQSAHEVKGEQGVCVKRLVRCHHGSSSHLLVCAGSATYLELVQIKRRNGSRCVGALSRKRTSEPQSRTTTWRHTSIPCEITPQASYGLGVYVTWISWRTQSMVRAQPNVCRVAGTQLTPSTALSGTTVPHYECGAMPWDARDNHMKNECPFRPVPCRLGCGQTVPARQVQVRRGARGQ